MLDTADFPSDRELVLERLIDVPAEKLFKLWTTPERMGEWFCPKPWRVTEARMDVRAGGDSYIVMEGPDGEVMPNPGVYLEVIPNQKLVFTDAFTKAWEPSAKPFMVGIITFEDLGGGKTRYRAVARHWTVEDRQAHEAMGFHEGWGIVADQMAEVAATL